VTTHRIEVPGSYVCDYQIRSSENPSRLVLLLHGYTLAGPWMLSKCGPALPPELEKNSVILAPNAPFPIPEKTKDGYKVGFSWYFYDPAIDDYFIDMKVACRFLIEMIRKLGFENLPVTIIGFSQGGYLAPFVAQEVPKVDHIIGIACQFLNEELELNAQIRMDQIHGANDDTVDPLRARKSHDALTKSGIKGEFYLLPGVGHRFSHEVQTRLTSLLS